MSRGQACGEPVRWTVSGPGGADEVCDRHKDLIMSEWPKFLATPYPDAEADRG